MKHVKLFEEFLNEANINVPKEAKELAKILKSKWKEHYDLGSDVYVLDYDSDLEILWNTTEDWGDVGFQIADEDGNDLYIGTNPKKAAKAIKHRKPINNDPV